MSTILKGDAVRTARILLAKQTFRSALAKQTFRFELAKQTGSLRFSRGAGGFALCGPKGYLLKAGQKNETKGRRALVLTTSVVSDGPLDLRDYYFVPPEVDARPKHKLP